MTRRLLPSALILLVAAAVAACSTPDAPPPATVTVTEHRITSVPPTTETVTETVTAEAQAPALTFECMVGPYQPGSAKYSDGTTGFEAACAPPGTGNPYGPDHREGAVPAT